ncbi:DMT family transporter [Oceanicoccus sp. KOV_DT_Chl]|uniref:DMT family transporter n=1 Tax=Oceanicoccus sp. KOV_DT_Chl TaxID=1904639 RepID=UPI000C7A7271|nr:DMT family transporter [Oceanicoccus sp. KOV_DT_Chl]
MQFQPPEQNFIKGISLGIMTVAIGSCVGAIGKHLTTLVDISAIVLFQYLICFLFTLPWIIKHGPTALTTAHPWQHIIRGVSGCLCFYTYYVALKYIPLVDASLLRNTAPLVVPLILFIGFHAAIPKVRWLPLIIGFIGIAVILRPAQQGLSLWHLVGFSSGVGLAISMVFTRVLAQHEPESRILFYYFFISLLFVVPFFAFNYAPIPMAALPWLILVGVAMYFTFILYTRAYAYVNASVVAPTSYFAVVFAGILDWIFWDHFPDIWTLVGITLVILGGLLLLRLGDK